MNPRTNIIAIAKSLPKEPPNNGGNAKYKKLYPEADLERLAVAWVTGEVSSIQVRTALKQKSTSSATFVMAASLRRGVLAGNLKFGRP
jgi:hypothetical protein